MAQVTDEFCECCGAHFEVLDIDMQEHEEFGLCIKCYDDPNVDYNDEKGWYVKFKEGDPQYTPYIP